MLDAANPSQYPFSVDSIPFNSYAAHIPLPVAKLQLFARFVTGNRLLLRRLRLHIVGLAAKRDAVVSDRGVTVVFEKAWNTGKACRSKIKRITHANSELGGCHSLLFGVTRDWICCNDSSASVSILFTSSSQVGISAWIT